MNTVAMNTVAEQIAELKRIGLVASTMPDRLAQTRAILSNLRADLESASSLVKDREAETLSLVSAETLPDSAKPAFSNKESREAEVRQRLAEDVTYKFLVGEEQNAQRQKSDVEIQLAKLQDEDRLIDRQLEAVAASLRAETVQLLRQALVDFVSVEARRLTDK